MMRNRFAAVFLAACLTVGAAAFIADRPGNDLVAYGHRLVIQTFAVIGPDTDKPFAGNRLACQNCHLDAGTKPSAIPLIGIDKIYPKFSTRSGRVITLAERIDECMTRSMNGRKLPEGSREMAAFIAYIHSLDGSPAEPPPAPAAETPPDVARGAEVFGRICATCHQPDGLGKRAAMGYEFPPLWGPDSFNDGAGMDRFNRVVGFVQHNMPRGVDPAHPQLTLQQAWDVAALLQSKPRPHYEGR
jgi:thiosulfate dehydrogenase